MISLTLGERTHKGLAGEQQKKRQHSSSSSDLSNQDIMIKEYSRNGESEASSNHDLLEPPLRRGNSDNSQGYRRPRSHSSSMFASSTGEDEEQQRIELLKRI